MLALDDSYFMALALKEAKNACNEGEIPVGALVVCQNQIIAKAYNQTEKLHDCTAHAEMLAITAASDYLGAKYLRNCTLYVTLEPCVMCAGALYWSQIGTVVIGASDAKRGFTTLGKSVLHPKTILKKGILLHDCETILKDFFVKLREV